MNTMTFQRRPLKVSAKVHLQVSMELKVMHQVPMKNLRVTAMSPTKLASQRHKRVMTVDLKHTKKANHTDKMLMRRAKKVLTKLEVMLVEALVLELEQVRVLEQKPQDMDKPLDKLFLMPKLRLKLKLKLMLNLMFKLMPVLEQVDKDLLETE